MEETTSMKAGTNLEKILESGRFAVTAEAGPPKGTNPAVVQKKADILRDCCDAVNITDNQTAIVRMSSIAGCVLTKQAGVEPVMQMVVRDRNRLALQADILGGIALGIGNFLCLSGDHQKFGNHPQAKGVFDIDSIQFIQMMKQMRDEKKFLNGDEISGDVPIYIGAAANPFADPFEYRVRRLAKKVKAGVDFIQTQAIYDLERFRKYMEKVCELGLDKKVHILAGVIPIRALGMARYMKNNVSGVIVPDEIISRLEKAEKPKEEGVNLILDIIEQLKEIPGVHGIHIMAVGWEDIVPEIVTKAGLMPRPVILD
jgi:methylenetetrahydrofolate reductase (NADPH)